MGLVDKLERLIELRHAGQLKRSEYESAKTQLLPTSQSKLSSGMGCRGCYLIQHSAGSGKSNSIAWLSHQLIALAKEERSVFESRVRRNSACQDAEG